ncbi:MAG: hypothetical protein SGPRY_011754 [Prymnesium sp.]
MSTEAAGRLGSLSLSVWQMGRNAALGAAEYMTPVLRQSAFGERGVITPDEFVLAGDQLVLRCPTWQWSAGEPSKARPFLPADKQFLSTRNVPSQQRAASLESFEEEAEEGWVATKQQGGPEGEPPSLDGGEAELACAMGASETDDGVLLESNIVKTRTYDVSITYDKYYQCARVWLYGYSESRQPLSQEEILEDISADHALKTVTLEAHPHITAGAGLHASIHPCKHAAVMKKLYDELANGGRE